MVDTLLHLGSQADVARLAADVFAALEPGGTFIATFRDFTVETKELERFIPFKRFGNPEELAAAAVFLASPAASYITGILLPVDAGLRVLEAGPR